jgi:hypothetical protein
MCKYCPRGMPRVGQAWFQAAATVFIMRKETVCTYCAYVCNRIALVDVMAGGAGL